MVKEKNVMTDTNWIILKVHGRTVSHPEIHKFGYLILLKQKDSYNKRASRVIVLTVLMALCRQKTNCCLDVSEFLAQ